MLLCINKCICIREAWPLRPYPPHLELSGHIFLGYFFIEFKKSIFFSLWPGPYTPPTLSGRVTKKRTFFAASLMHEGRAGVLRVRVFFLLQINLISFSDFYDIYLSDNIFLQKKMLIFLLFSSVGNFTKIIY